METAARYKATFLESRGYASDWKSESSFGGERRNWSELIGKKSGEIKGQEFYLDRECPYHPLRVMARTVPNE